MNKKRERCERSSLSLPILFFPLLSYLSCFDAFRFAAQEPLENIVYKEVKLKLRPPETVTAGLEGLRDDDIFDDDINPDSRRNLSRIPSLRPRNDNSSQNSASNRYYTEENLLPVGIAGSHPIERLFNLNLSSVPQELQADVTLLVKNAMFAEVESIAKVLKKPENTIAWDNTTTSGAVGGGDFFKLDLTPKPRSQSNYVSDTEMLVGNRNYKELVRITNFNLPLTSFNIKHFVKLWADWRSNLFYKQINFASRIAEEKAAAERAVLTTPSPATDTTTNPSTRNTTLTAPSANHSHTLSHVDLFRRAPQSKIRWFTVKPVVNFVKAEHLKEFKENFAPIIAEVDKRVKNWLKMWELLERDDGSIIPPNFETSNTLVSKRMEDIIGLFKDLLLPSTADIMRNVTNNEVKAQIGRIIFDSLKDYLTRIDVNFAHLLTQGPNVKDWVVLLKWATESDSDEPYLLLSKLTRSVVILYGETRQERALFSSDGSSASDARINVLGVKLMEDGRWAKVKFFRKEPEMCEIKSFASLHNVCNRELNVNPRSQFAIDLRYNEIVRAHRETMGIE